MESTLIFFLSLLSFTFLKFIFIMSFFSTPVACHIAFIPSLLNTRYKCHPIMGFTCVSVIAKLSWTILYLKFRIKVCAASSICGICLRPVDNYFQYHQWFPIFFSLARQNIKAMYLVVSVVPFFFFFCSCIFTIKFFLGQLDHCLVISKITSLSK